MVVNADSPEGRNPNKGQQRYPHTRPAEWRPAETGPMLSFNEKRPTMALLNANPYAEGIANLGAQVIAAEVAANGWNVEPGFADTCTPKSPFLANFATPDECAIVGISVPFENTYHHIPRMLRACNIAVYAANRPDDAPIVVGGGMALINPMPLSPFFDAMVIGEGRDAIVAINDCVAHARRRKVSRHNLLIELAQIPHVYVPTMYDIEQDNIGAVTSFTTRDGAPSLVTPGRPLDMTTRPIFSSWTTSRACYKYDDYFSVMVAMGCHLKCPFCVVGNVQGEAGGRAATTTREVITELSLDRRQQYGTNLVKLFFASSFAPQSSMDPLSLRNLIGEMLEHGFECRVGSLNIKQADADLLALVRSAGQTRVTFAPETGSSLRQSIGKPYSRDDKLVFVAEEAGRQGMGLDIYTMMVFPARNLATSASLPRLYDRCAPRFRASRPLRSRPTQLSRRPRRPMNDTPPFTQSRLGHGSPTYAAKLATRPASRGFP